LEKILPDLIAEIEKAWTGEGSIRLMFMDEGRFDRILDTRRCWCPKPIRPVCFAMVSQEYTHAYAAISVSDDHMDSLILPHVNGEYMQVFLDEMAARHLNDRIIMVFDGAGWHKNESLIIPDNIHMLRLPPYSPKLNPVEHIWDDLREKEFYNRVFDTIDSHEDHLEKALHDMEHDHDRIHSIVTWPWIINILMN
jgi:transposase